MKQLQNEKNVRKRSVPITILAVDFYVMSGKVKYGIVSYNEIMDIVKKEVVGYDNINGIGISE